MALLIVAILFIANTNAQIVYTDIIPDSTASFTSSLQIAGGSKTFNFDIINDGINDVSITIILKQLRFAKAKLISFSYTGVIMV